MAYLGSSNIDGAKYAWAIAALLEIPPSFSSVQPIEIFVRVENHGLKMRPEEERIPQRRRRLEEIIVPAVRSVGRRRRVELEHNPFGGSVVVRFDA